MKIRSILISALGIGFGFFVLKGMLVKFDFLRKLLFLNSFSLQSKQPEFKPVAQSFFDQMQKSVVSYTLQNGLEVVLLPDNREQRVFMQCAYRVGSANESSKTRGMAHLLEHMIFKGTEVMSESDLPKIAFKYGARLNAYTDYDYTVYFFDTDKENYSPFFDILADCMSNARIDAQHLASELKAVVQELNMCKDDVWEELFNLVNKGLLPANHPYANPVIGYVQQLAWLEADDLRKFYKKHYHPANATLFVIGDFDVQAVKQEIQDKFGAIPSTGKRAEPMFPPVIQEPKVVKAELMHNVATPCVKLLWITPGLENMQAFAARKVLASALHSGKSGRLYKKLVDEHKVATSVMVDDPSKIVQAYSKAGFFEVSITCAQENVDKCVELVLEELAQIFKHGLTESELAQAKAKEVTNFVNLCEHGYGHGYNEFAFLWKCFYFATNDLQAFFSYPVVLQGISNDDVAKFVGGYLRNNFYGCGVAKPITKETADVCSAYQAALKVEEAKVLENHKRTTKVEEPRQLYQVPDVQPMDFVMPKPTFDKTLANGLRVVAIERKGIPSVSCVFQNKNSQWITNALDIKDSTRGAAGWRQGSIDSFDYAMVADLLIDKTVGFSKDQNNKLFDTLGAQVSLGASAASLYATSPNFKEAFEHFVKVCFSPEFAQEDLSAQKVIAADAIASHKASNRYLALNTYYQQAFQGTDFAWSLDQAIEKINACSVDKLRKVHRESFSPENLVMVIVGDFSSETLSDCTKILESIGKGFDKGCSKVVPAPSPVEQEFIKIKTPSDQQFMLIIRPSTFNFGDKDAPLLNMLTELVLSGMGSQVWALREQTGLFYSAGGAYASHLRVQDGAIAAPFDMVRAIVNPKNALVLRDEIVGMFAKVSSGKTRFVQEDVDGARQSYLQDLINICASNKNMSDVFAKLVVLNLDFDYFDKSWQSVSNVTQADIQRLSKELCNLDSMTTLLVGGQD